MYEHLNTKMSYLIRRNNLSLTSRVNYCLPSICNKSVDPSWLYKNILSTTFSASFFV